MRTLAEGEQIADSVNEVFVVFLRVVNYWAVAMHWAPRAFSISADLFHVIKHKDWSSAAGWTEPGSVRVFDYDIQAVPILTDGHWSVVVADVRSGVVHASNSLNRTHGHVPAVVCWWLSHDSGQAARRKEWLFLPVDVAQQTNFADCGAYTACSPMAIALGRMPHSVRQQCAAIYRTHMARAIASIVNEAPTAPGVVAAREVGVVHGAALAMNPVASALRLGVIGPQSVPPAAQSQRISPFARPPVAPADPPHPFAPVAPSPLRQPAPR